MQSQAAHHNIELAIAKGQILRIASSKRNIFYAALSCSSTSNVQHGLSQIHSHNFARVFCKGLRDVPRASCNVQNAFRARQSCSRNQPRDALLIENQGLAAKAVACEVKESRTISLCVVDMPQVYQHQIKKMPHATRVGEGIFSPWV